MEITVNENDAQQSFRSPPKRRRSTFFERRDSIVPLPFSENIEANECEKRRDVDLKYNQELLRYRDKLLAEKNDWKTEVQKRQYHYHDLRQQYQLATKSQSKSRLLYSSLSTEDIEFLKGKVNTSKILDNLCKFHKSVKETQELYRKAMGLDGVILQHCIEKADDGRDYILETSTI